MPRGRAADTPDGGQLADYFARLFGCAMGRSLRQALDTRLAEGVPATDIRQAMDRAHAFGPRDPCAYFRTLLRRLTPAPPAAALAAPAPLADWERPGRLRASLWLKGPAARGPCWHLSWVTLRPAWLRCRAGREMAVPYGVLWPCLPRASGVVGHTVATPRLVTVMWV